MKQKLFYSFPVRKSESHFLFLQREKNILEVYTYYALKYVLGTEINSPKKTVGKNETVHHYYSSFFCNKNYYYSN